MNTLKKLAMKILDGLTPSCDVITEKISESLDRKLSLKERLQIKVHLMYCKYCLRYRDQIMYMRRLLEKDSASILKDVKLDAAQKSRMKEQIRKSCQR